ncbi:putative porin [Thalassotalea fusca]
MFKLTWILLLIGVTTYANAAENQLNLKGSTLLRYEHEYGANNQVADRKRLRTIVKFNAQYYYSDSLTFQLKARTGQSDNPGAPAITLVRFDDHKIGDRDLYLEHLNINVHHEVGNTLIGQQSMPLRASTDFFWDKDIPVLGATFKRHDNADTVFGENMTWSAHLSTINEGAGDYIGQLTSLSGELKPSNSWKVALNFVHYQGKAGAENLTKDTANDGSFGVVSLRYSVSKMWPVDVFADVFKNFDVHGATNKFSGQDIGGGIGIETRQLPRLPNWHFKYQYAYVERHAAIDDFAQNGLSRFARTNVKGHDLHIKYNFNKRHFIRLRFARTQQIIGSETGNRLRLDYLWRW